MKHILITPEICPCDKNNDDRCPCPVCYWGFNVCSVCGGAEGDLIGNDGKENECPGLIGFGPKISGDDDLNLPHTY